MKRTFLPLIYLRTKRPSLFEINPEFSVAEGKKLNSLVVPRKEQHRFEDSHALVWFPDWAPLKIRNIKSAYLAEIYPKDFKISQNLLNMILKIYSTCFLYILQSLSQFPAQFPKIISSKF